MGFTDQALSDRVEYMFTLAIVQGLIQKLWLRCDKIVKNRR